MASVRLGLSVTCAVGAMVLWAACDDGSKTNDSGSPRECADADGDGYSTCAGAGTSTTPAEVDCDDTNAWVQPGAYEFVGNLVDDDCDGSVDEPSNCACPGAGNATPEQMAEGMGLCNATLQSAIFAGESEQRAAPDDYHGILPAEGACVVALSTGDISSDEGYEVNDGGLGRCQFADPGANPDGAEICDMTGLKLKLRPPPNAHGFEFAFLFMSAEWPEYLCSEYNDTFYALYTSPSVTDGVPMNISFDFQGNDISVNTGFFQHPSAWSVPLADTPFGEIDDFAECGFPVDSCVLPDYCDISEGLSHIGSTTGWLLTRAPLDPSDGDIELKFVIFDEGDDALDSLVLIDRFRWLLDAPPIGTVKL